MGRVMGLVWGLGFWGALGEGGWWVDGVGLGFGSCVLRVGR